MKDEFNNIFCSAKAQDFILLYDGLGTYYLFYQNDMLLEEIEELNPIELDKQTNLYMPYLKFKEDNQIEFLNKLLKTIADTIGDKPKYQSKIMTALQTLIVTLRDAEKNKDNKRRDFLSNAPQVVRDKAVELSISKGLNPNVYDELVTPQTIEDEIKARAKPVLTNEEKAKAEEIQKQIDEIGLLPYLNQILDNIHIGEHKNIYRKLLSVFKIMRGEASFISETTAKAEQGKSFEDDIVYGLITPKRYIFEVNQITEASFVRYGIIDPNYYDRLIIYLGDLGAKKSFSKAEPILNIVKPLITESKYKYIKSNTDNDFENIEIPFQVNSIGAVYQTTKNSFTKDDNQLMSRTLYSTPAKVEPTKILRQTFYLKDKNSRQSKARAKAEQNLRDFGLYLLMMVNKEIEIINPYEDVFIEYSLKSENPIREVNQQLELFNAYCILTYNKCNVEILKGERYIASQEQLKEYMDYINLENALIPYEYDFLDMLLAKGKAKELTILYNESDLMDEDGNFEDLDLDSITTLTECENTVIEQMNDKLQSRFEDIDPIQTKADLTNKQLKELPQKLLSNFGFRSGGAKQRIFFRFNDLKSYYGKRTAYKNIEDVPGLLQTLYNKGYLGKYEYKQGRENLYYLTPMCNNLTSDFKPKKSYNRYVSEYFANTGYEDY